MADNEARPGSTNAAPPAPRIARERPYVRLESANASAWRRPAEAQPAPERRPSPPSR